MSEMMQVALNGKGAMPPKGGATHLSDFEIERAVVYMANAAGGNFEEPAEPVAEGEEAAAEGEQATAAAGDSAAAPAPQAAEPAAGSAGTESADAGDAAPAAATDAAATTPAAPQGTEQTAAPEQADTAPAQEAAAEGSTTVAAADAGGIQIRPEADTIGKKIYETSCFACHGTGVANAPKTGNKQDWAPYIATGMDEMLKVAIQGKGAMPPRGTAMNASDDELQLAIEYMIKDALYVWPSRC